MASHFSGGNDSTFGVDLPEGTDVPTDAGADGLQDAGSGGGERLRLCQHARDGILHVDPLFGGERATQLLDLYGIAESVEHDVRALTGEGAGDAETNAAGRARHDRVAASQRARVTGPHHGFLLAHQHGHSFLWFARPGRFSMEAAWRRRCLQDNAVFLWI